MLSGSTANSCTRGLCAAGDTPMPAGVVPSMRLRVGVAGAPVVVVVVVVARGVAGAAVPIVPPSPGVAAAAEPSIPFPAPSTMIGV